MIKQIRIHIVLLLFMYTIFILSTLTYGRKFSDDTIKVIGYYGVFVIILFILNLIKKRVFRWSAFIFVLFLPISYLILTGTKDLNYTSLNILLSGAQMNAPFLPENLTFELKNHLENVVITYSLYFLLPLFYWYGLYFISKKIVNRLFTSNKTTL